jgi:uracil-DNA glycosylase
MTDVERRTALEEIAAEVRVCTRCRLHQTRTRAVPGEGDPDTEVIFVGEGPGFNEDREGRPFVGRAGGLLVKLLASIGWRREDVFITNVVKCRPPDNRDPQPDEIAACAPYLRRQLEVLDPAVVVTLGRFSMGTFMPGARISQAHGTIRPVDPDTGARSALVFAMYHPAAALRTPAIERESYADIAAVPSALLDSRRRREEAAVPEPTDMAVAADGPVAIRVETAVVAIVGEGASLDVSVADATTPPLSDAEPVTPPAPAAPVPAAPTSADEATPQLTLF